MDVQELPFKHAVIDNALPEAMAEMIYSSMVKLQADESWYEYNNVFEVKRATDDLEKIPNEIRRLFTDWFSSRSFILTVEKAFNIKGLVTDYTNRGGGLHYIYRDGFLNVHKDFSKHPQLGLIRKINAILYMNKEYTSHFGGELELWEKDMSKCSVVVRPLFNRLVVFETTDAPHGHTNKWQSELPRMSCAFYLYAAPTVEDLQKDHKSTQFLKTPLEETTQEIEELREKRNGGRIASNINSIG